MMLLKSNVPEEVKVIVVNCALTVFLLLPLFVVVDKNEFELLSHTSPNFVKTVMLLLILGKRYPILLHLLLL